MGVSLARIDWATPADGPAITPLISLLYAHDVPDAPTPKPELIAEHLALLLSPDTPHQLIIGWVEDGTALGLAAIAFFVSVSDPRQDRWRQVELKELFVHPKARDHGVGQALMTWIEGEAKLRGAHRIDWHVHRANNRGIAFYQRFGAQIVEHRLSMRKAVGDVQHG